MRICMRRRNVLRAYSAAHLNWLRGFVQAELRGRRYDPEYGWSSKLWLVGCLAASTRTIVGHPAQVDEQGLPDFTYSRR
jgi:hypothetical protein